MAEFRDHLHTQDRQKANDLREELATELALATDRMDQFRLGYWVAKNEKNLTIPGFWAINVDILESKKRNIMIWANDQMHVRSEIKMGNRNNIGISKWN